jgi:hypothetical protein
MQYMKWNTSQMKRMIWYIQMERKLSFRFLDF